MSDNDEPKVTSISNASSLEEIAEFWDTHSLAEHEEQTHEVEFEVCIDRAKEIVQ
jgi:hypothetical protein